MKILHPSLRDRRVFVDSSAYLALIDQGDAHHYEAVGIITWLADQHYRQFTTNTLIIESHALILSTLGIATAAQFLRNMDESHTTVVRTRARDEEHAKQILFRYSDKDFSFADAISFAIMERLGISDVFTFDRHFAQYGLGILKSDRL